MKSTILILSVLFGHLTYGKIDERYLTHLSKSIIIDKPIEEVFNHVKDTMNDDTWRSEVNQMQADGSFQVGTTYTEDAHIGLRRNFITKTVLVEVRENEKAYYETPDEAKYALTSLREVEKISDSKTKFTYTVEFDSRMSRETLGLNLRPGILQVSYGVIMAKYLRNLKRYLE